MAVSDDVIDTLIAEAGGNIKGLHAVSAVIANRAAQSGLTPDQVVKQPNQFEGYSNPGRASREAQKSPHIRALAEKAYNDIVSGAVPDPTNGGTQFRAASASGVLGKNVVNIGGNVFKLGNAPTSAVAAIDAVAPIPRSIPTSLSAYADTPAVALPPLPIPRPNPPQSVPLSLTDALRSKYTSVAPSADAASSYGGILPRLAPFVSEDHPRSNAVSRPISLSADQSVGGPDQFLPTAARVFIPSILGAAIGSKPQISQRDFSQQELAVLERAAQNAEAVGRNNIVQHDYSASLIPRKGDPLNDRDLVNQMQKTIGGAQFTRDANGDLVITDKYDFRDIGIDGPLDGYGIAHAVGSSLLPEGSGRDVNIRITPKAVSPEFSRGALGQQMRSVAPPIPQSLTSRSVHTVQIDPFTGNPVGSNAPFVSADHPLSNAVAAPASPKTIYYNSTAGNVALPKGVVPASVTRDLASIAGNQMNRSGSPDDRQAPAPQLAPTPLPARPSALSSPYIQRNSNDVVRSVPYVPPTPSPSNYTDASNPLYIDRLGLTVGPPVAPAVQAIQQAAPTTRQVLNPAYAKWVANPVAISKLQDIHDFRDDATMAAQGSAARLPAPPKYISIPVPGSSPQVSLPRPRPQLVPVQQPRATGGLLGLLFPGTNPAALSMIGQGFGGAPSAPLPAPGANFLAARDVPTAGLNISQMANELNKQMASSSRNADGSRGFGVA